MPQEFRCQHCREPFGVTPEMMGTTVACPHCNKSNLLRSKTAPVPPPPPNQSRPASPQPKRKSEAKPIPREKGSDDLMPPPRKREKRGSSDTSSKPAPPPISRSDLQPPGSKSDRSAGDELMPPKAPPQSKKKLGTSPHVPPKKRASEKKVPDKEPTSAEQSTPGINPKQKLTQQEVIEQLLPPKFLVGQSAATARASAGMVLIPDSEGGYREVEASVATIEHGGRQIKLRSYSRAEQSRRRQIFGISIFIFCMLILLLAFYLLW
jgi:hypothetical protein